MTFGKVRQLLFLKDYEEDFIFSQMRIELVQQSNLSGGIMRWIILTIFLGINLIFLIEQLEQLLKDSMFIITLLMVAFTPDNDLGFQRWSLFLDLFLMKEQTSGK